MKKEFAIQTNNEQCTLKVHIQTNAKMQPVRAMFYHPKQSATVYYENVHRFSGRGYFFVRLPQSPKEGVLSIESPGMISMPNIPYEVMPLQQKLDAFDYKNPYIKEVVNFIQWFSEDFSLLSSRGSCFLSRKGNFRIDVHDVLIYRGGKMAGKVSKSPARIGADTKITEVAKSHFINYSIPERATILFHELGHGYLNHDSQSEFEADRNALDIALGLGYPRSAIKKIFAKVFYSSPTEGNLKRWEMIKSYIDNFAKGDLSDDYYYKEETRR